MERIQFIEVDGVRILRQDFSHLDAATLIPLLTESAKIVRSQPEDSILAVTLVHDIRLSREANAALKEYVSENRPYVKAGAVCGIGWLMPVMFMFNSLTGRQIRAFDTEEEAIDWLLTRAD